MPEKWSKMVVVYARTYSQKMVVAWVRRAGVSFLDHLTWSLKSFLPEYGHLTGSLKIVFLCSGHGDHRDTAKHSDHFFF